MGAYGRYDLIYVKTDKNGTKYYHDINCPRCSGYGALEKWAYTGRVCYECGGEGKRVHPKTIKIYTPEYEAKLEARRAAKAAKYEEEHAEEIAEAKAEEERKEAERKQRKNEQTSKELGCAANGIGYVLTGNTYPVKEEIKKNGGKWVGGTWVCPIRYEANGVKAIEIDLTKFINEYGLISYGEGLDLIWETSHR